MHEGKSKTYLVENQDHVTYLVWQVALAVGKSQEIVFFQEKNQK